MDRIKQNRLAAAFTLVEMLVVIGIITVIIAILMPALRRAREHANRVACQSNLRQISMAVTMYRQDNRKYWPMIYQVHYPTTGSPYNRTYPYRLWNYLGKYYGDTPPLNTTTFGRHIFYCPSVDLLRRVDFPRPAGTMTPAWCEGDGPGQFIICTYNMISGMGYTNTVAPTGIPPDRAYHWLKPKRKLTYPERTCVIIDGGSNAAAGFGAPRVDHSFRWWDSRHLRGANMIMGDGSVIWRRHAETDALMWDRIFTLYDPDLFRYGF